MAKCPWNLSWRVEELFFVDAVSLWLLVCPWAEDTWDSFTLLPAGEVMISDGTVSRESLLRVAELLSRDAAESEGWTLPSLPMVEASDPMVSKEEAKWNVISIL